MKVNIRAGVCKSVESELGLLLAGINGPMHNNRYFPGITMVAINKP